MSGSEQDEERSRRNPKVSKSHRKTRGSVARYLPGWQPVPHQADPVPQNPPEEQQ